MVYRLVLVCWDAGAGDRNRAGRAAVACGPIHVLPLIGLLLLVLWGGAEIVNALRNLTGLRIAGAGILIVSGFMTFQQASLWKDTDTLFRHTLKVAPENPVALHSYGLSLMAQNRNREAGELFAEAIRIWPPFTDAYVSLGTAFVKQSKIQEGIEVYQKVIELAPREMLGHYNLAVALEMQDKLEEATRSSAKRSN